MMMMNTKKMMMGAALAAGTVCGGISDAATIAIEDFDGSTPTWSNDIASQTFVDPTDSDQGLFIQASSTDNANFSGNSAFARDLDGESGEPELAPFVFTFDNVDTSSFTDIVLTFDFAATANADEGDYIVVLNGVDQTAVTFFDDPEDGVSGTVTENIGTASTVGLKLTGTLNSSDDTLELDNFQLTGVPEPASLALLGLGGLMMLGRRRAR